MKGAKLTTISPPPANMRAFIETFAVQFKSLELGNAQQQTRYDVEAQTNLTDDSVTFKFTPDPEALTQQSVEIPERYSEMESYLTFNFEQDDRNGIVIVKLFVDLVGPKSIETMMKLMRRLINRILAKQLKSQVESLIRRITSGEVDGKSSEMAYTGPYREEPLPKSTLDILVEKHSCHALYMIFLI